MKNAIQGVVVVVGGEVQVDKCKSCYEEIDYKEYTMPCTSCKVCGNCCLQYLLSQIDHIDFNIEKDIKCPNHKCRRLYKVGQFRQHYSNGIEQTIPRIQHLDFKLFLKHLQNDPQVRNCPNSQCTYYGLLPDYNYSANECKNAPLQCEMCKTEWQDIMIYNEQQTLLEKLKKIILQKNELFSEMYKKLSAKRCGRCKIPISKYGGCHHMVCRKCNYEFCWYCEQTYSTHSIYRCALQIIVSNSLYLMSLILFIYFSGIYKLIWTLFLSFLHFVISAVLQNILFFFLYLYSTFTYDYMKNRRSIHRFGFDKQTFDSQKRNLHLSLLNGFIFFVYLATILYFQYTVLGICKFIFLEIVAISGTYASFTAMRFLWETWMIFTY